MGESGDLTAVSHPEAEVPIRAAKVSRTALLDDLRQRIDALERNGRATASLPRRFSLSQTYSLPVPLSGVGDATVPPDQRMPPHPPPASPTLSVFSAAEPSPTFSPAFFSSALHAERWTFGTPDLDALLPDGALDVAALHEIKPRSYLDWPAALLFACRLAVRRFRAGVSRGVVPTLLWCHTTARGNDLGRPYGPGLERLGLPAEALIIVETARASETLWAMEEGLGARGVALVVGSVDRVDLTPSRRLSLAAAAARTPCLLLTAPEAAAAPAATTRWRVGRAPSAGQRFDAAAVGSARLALDLERCRGSTPLLETVSSTVEWCDAARGFRLVACVGHRAPGARATGRRAG